MWICICNTINEATMRKAVAECTKSPQNPRQIYEHLGAKDRCGQCAAEITRMIAEKQAPAEPSAQPQRTPENTPAAK